VTVPMVYAEWSGGPGVRVVLSGPAHHYLAHVVRVEVGSRVRLSDAGGRGAQARVVRIAAADIEVEVEQVEESTGSNLRVSLLVSHLKQGGSEEIVAAAAELGVERIIVTAMERSVARPNAAVGERLGRVAREVARKVGRTWVTTVETAGNLDDALNRVAGCPLYFLSHESGREVGELALRRGGPVAVAVGPEGGWSRAEEELLRLRSAIPVRLRGPAYRARTAAVAAAVLFLHHGGDL